MTEKKSKKKVSEGEKIVEGKPEEKEVVSEELGMKIMDTIDPDLAVEWLETYRKEQESYKKLMSTLEKLLDKAGYKIIPLIYRDQIIAWGRDKDTLLEIPVVKKITGELVNIQVKKSGELYEVK